jgi:putative 4-mercaptohistidine N1-methyltranferase
MASKYYESDRAVSEYLVFHYGMSGRMLPPVLVESGALNFPVHCVTQCLDARRLPARARALDLGCAVGRASFELARRCAEVVGIDHSKRFIATAGHLRKHGSVHFGSIEEGELSQASTAIVPEEIQRKRVIFERGDAMNLRRNLGKFDVVLMANLIDRLREPRKCLAQLPHLLKSGGQLIIASPYTWLLEYTPRKNWLGGFVRGGRRIKTFDTLKEILSPEFQLARRRDLPFLIREHARKFQLGVAEATVWIRK